MTKEIQLNLGKAALVDDEDYEWLSQWKWFVDESSESRIYASRKSMRNKKTTKIYMHRAIMGNPDGMSIDHINSNCLDNRRSNLRICTKAQNARHMRKRAGREYKGVNKTPTGRWNAEITVDYKQIYLGTFDDRIVAAKRYNEAAKEYFGDFALLNDIQDEI